MPASLCTRLHLWACVCTRARNQVRGRGGQIGRGLWGSECMLGAGLCSLCTLCRSRAREGSEGGGGTEERASEGGGLPESRPCGKTLQEEEEDTQQAAREQY